MVSETTVQVSLAVASPLSYAFGNCCLIRCMFEADAAIAAVLLLGQSRQ